MTWVGQSIERVEDAALLTGRGRYIDDIGVPPGTLHAAVLRSPHPHAAIRAIDVAAARSAKGVAAVITGARRHRARRAAARRREGADPVLADRGRARALCRRAGRRGGGGGPLSRRGRARADRGRLRSAAGHLAARRCAQARRARCCTRRSAATSRATAHSATAIRKPRSRRRRTACRSSVNYPRNSCTPIETYGLIADYDPGEDAYDILATFQGPFSIHAVLARALKVPGNRLRLRMPPDAGGSFGVKQGIFPYIALMGIAARVAGRPVKWIEDRLEHLTASVSATNRLITLDAAVEADGRVTALAWDQVEDVGAHIRAPEPATLYRMHGNLTGAYDIRNVSVRNRVVLTNKTPTGLNRGFGGPQVYYALERLMQRVAVELKLDPLDVIRRNLVPSGVFPFRTATGGLLDSGDYPACVAQAVERGRPRRIARRAQTQARARGPALRHRPHRGGRAERLEHGLHHHRADARGAAQGRAEERRAGDRHDRARSGRRGVGACRLGAAGPGPPHRGGADRRRRARAEALRHPRRHRHGHRARRLVDRVGQLCQPLRARGRRRGAARGRADEGEARARRRRPAQRAGGRDRVRARARAREGQSRQCAAVRAARRGRALGAGTLPEDDQALRETVFWTPPQLTAPTEDDGINSSLCHGFIFDFCGVEVDRVPARCASTNTSPCTTAAACCIPAWWPAR